MLNIGMTMEYVAKSPPCINSACWVFFPAFLLTADIFQNHFFFQKFLSVSNTLGPNYFIRLSADDSCRQRLNGAETLNV